MAEQWNLLRDAATTATILAVDFESARAEPALRDLTPHVEVTQTVRQPPALDLGTFDPPPGAYSGAWAAEVRRQGWDVAAVLGHCAGGALALELAGQFAERPAVILLDPYEVGSPMIGYQFRQAIDQFRTVLSEEDSTELHRWSRELCRTVPPPEAAERLAYRYAELTARAFADLGLTADLQAEFGDRFRRFATYLVAAWRAGYADSGSDPVVVLSRDEPLPPGLRGVVHRLPVTHDDLLTDPVTHSLVMSVLRGEPAYLAGRDD